MVAKVARVGDHGVGTCYQHKDPVRFTTVFSQGDPIVEANGKQVMRIGDYGQASCGHQTVALTGSGTVTGSNLKGLHRVGDRGEIVGGGGTYEVVSGSPDVEVGD